MIHFIISTISCTNEHSILGHTISEITNDLHIKIDREKVIFKEKQIRRTKRLQNSKIKVSDFRFEKLEDKEEHKSIIFHMRDPANGLSQFHNYSQAKSKEKVQEEIQYWFRSRIKLEMPYCSYIIFYKNTAIGEFNLYLIDNNTNIISYGITLVPSAKNMLIKGKGFGSIVLELIIDFICQLIKEEYIKDIKIIEALISSKNIPSIKINENNGFKRISEGNFRGAGHAYLYQIVLSD